jgi:hypothetical protein
VGSQHWAVSQHLCVLLTGSLPALLSGVIEERELGQHQVFLGRYCWKLRPVDDDGRARESRALLHPIYEVRQLLRVLHRGCVEQSRRVIPP